MSQDEEASRSETSEGDMNRNVVDFTCNCGEEIHVRVEPDSENEVRCGKCGQDYRFYGRSVLRF